MVSHSFKSTATVTMLLLISFIALQSFIMLTRKEIAANRYISAAKSINEIRVKTSTISGSSRKWLGGRSKGVMEEVKEARGTAKTGANNTVMRRQSHELRHRIRPSRTHFAGLVPFSSDYHTPKNHPPKNN